VKTILLKFAGPMQSWGTDSHFETRHTDLYPSKSAVIGLIGAALGIRRDDDIKELVDIKFAVRVDQEGGLLKDYHIARKYKTSGDIEGTYVTERYYLEDAVFVVAISHEDDNFIEKIYEALKRPYFQMFLGRRSIPVLADFILGNFDCDIRDALEKCEWQAKDYYKKRYNKSQKLLDVYCDKGVFDNADREILRQDKVISFSNKHRQFSFRYEDHAKIYVKNSMFEDEDTNHNIFDLVGE
jgi:CRISPR system CASCADE complex protein casD